MNLVEQSVENHMYLIEVNQILNDPTILNENMIEKLKGWTKNKFGSFSKSFLSAAKSKDINAIKKMKSAVPRMGLDEIADIGKKASSSFSQLQSIAESHIRKLSNNKLSNKQVKAVALVFALRATMDKNPKKSLNAMLKKVKPYSSNLKEQEEEVTSVDVTRWVLSIILGIVGTAAVASATGILFIFGPLILFGIFNALFIAAGME